MPAQLLSPQLLALLLALPMLLPPQLPLATPLLLLTCTATTPPSTAPQTLDEVWLAQGRYVAGAPQPTVADLQLACELEQLRLLDGAETVGAVG